MEGKVARVAGKTLYNFSLVSDMKEQRRHPRVPLRLEVNWSGSQTRPGVTTDVSNGGCYVESIVQVAVGDTLRFKFQLDDDRTLEIEGEIRYVHPTIGFGVRFGDTPNVQMQKLLALIRSALEAQNPPEQIASLASRPRPTRCAA
jgi:predicted transport protein